MNKLLLTKIRLSWYFIFFFLMYLLLAIILPRQKFDGGALTLFSVNSFLYGFYISPILSSQKARIEELHKIVRSEANALFAMALDTKDLPEKPRNKLQEMLMDYMDKNLHDHRVAGEKAYEELISYVVDYKGEGKEKLEKFLEKLVANQQNRTSFAMQMNSKVFSNEWMIMFVLFSITMSFVLVLDTGPQPIFRVVTALLCTGLSMLVLILIKMSTLTHKRAKQIWKPFEKLVESRFYRID